MAASLDRLESELLALSAEDRARLAERLLASLDDEPDGDPAATQRAWLDEADRRYQRHVAGEETARPDDEGSRGSGRSQSVLNNVRLLAGAESDLHEAASFLELRLPDWELGSSECTNFPTT